MENYLDLFLTAFIAGVCGGSAIMLGMSVHFKSIYMRYIGQKELVEQKAALKRCEYEIEQLKADLATLDKEVFKS